MKILVIEGSASSLQVLCHYIEKMGIVSIPAQTGSAAAELFLSERPDLVLVNVALPDIDGFEIIRRIRQREHPGDWTPIVCLTERDKDDDLENGIAAGADDHLLKPVGKVVLGAKIRAMQRIIQMRQSQLVLTRKLDAANQELQRLNSLDGLTGIANRRHFDELLVREWRRAMRQGSELAILMCDLDFFKQYNDAYGHLEGDECLRQVALTLVTSVDRGGDRVARYGGEEFIAVLPETTLAGAQFVAEKMRQAVSQLNLQHADSPFRHVTLSIGIASGIPLPASEPQTIVGAADRALYQAKQEGRNRVCRMTSPDQPTSPITLA
jgi:diguanylate cyclase (GGDEF)-like protein